MEALPIKELLGANAKSTLICSTSLDSHKFLLALEYLIFFFLGDPASGFMLFCLNLCFKKESVVSMAKGWDHACPAT